MELIRVLLHSSLCAEFHPAFFLLALHSAGVTAEVVTSRHLSGFPTQPGLEHYSFSDEVILRAAKAGNKEKEEMALRGLRLTEDVTTAFLNEVQVLRNEKQTTLHGSSDMSVKHFEAKN
jgi:hypothetical protein